MKVEKFYESLMPNMERKRLVEDLDQLREEIDKTVLPKLKESSDLQKGRRLESSYAKALEAQFTKTLPDYRQKSLFDGMAGVLNNVRLNLASIEKMIPDLFGKDITKESIDYRKANLLQYIQLSSFVVDYTLRALYRSVASEVYTSLNQADQIDVHLTPAEKKWFDENREAYFAALNAINLTNHEFMEKVDQIPNVNVVPENADLIRQTLSGAVLDPFRFGIVAPTSWNPLYQLRLVHAEAQVKRFRAKVEERRGLEYRLLQWKQAQQGKNDAKLAGEIEYSEGRLQRLTYEINEMQERYSHT